MSVVRIRESPYYRGFFSKKIYKNFVGTVETVRNREVSVLERCPYREVRLYANNRSGFFTSRSFLNYQGNVIFFRIRVRQQKQFSVRQWTMRKQRP